MTEPNEKRTKIVKLIIKYAVCFLIEGIMVWIVAENYSLATAESDLLRYRILADAFTVPGVAFLMLGLLVWVSTTGFFDGLSYALRRFGRIFTFQGASDATMKKYYDYKMERAGKRYSGYSCILISGAVFFAIALVFLVLYYQVK